VVGGFVLFTESPRPHMRDFLTEWFVLHRRWQAPVVGLGPMKVRELLEVIQSIQTIAIFLGERLQIFPLPLFEHFEHFIPSPEKVISHLFSSIGSQLFISFPPYFLFLRERGPLNFNLFLFPVSRPVVIIAPAESAIS